jgi:hypothetical protein
VYGLTDDQKADRLLDLAGLGDWKPSQLCAHIQSLAVDWDILLRLRQLPEDVRVQVSALDATSLHDLARKADVIMAAKRTPALINTSAQPGKRRPAHSSDKPTVCWYHAKFGARAKACRPPCAYILSTGEPLAPPGNEQANT